MPNDPTFVPNDSAPYARKFGPYSAHFSTHARDNATYIHVTQGWMNDKLRAHGHVFLNEVYDVFDIPRTAAGQLVGWFKEEGSNDVEITIVDDSVDGGIILDFNPDGVIYNKLA